MKYSLKKILVVSAREKYVKLCNDLYKCCICKSCYVTRVVQVSCDQSCRLHGVM